MKPLAFWIPALSWRVASSNGGSAGSRRNPWAVRDAKNAMADATEAALIPTHQPLPKFDRVRLYITGHIVVHARPKLEDCPRCLHAWLAGERWKDASGVSTCRCYRPTDVPNMGGDVTKKIPDKLVELKVIQDDDYRHLDALVYRIERESELGEEGIAVVVEPLEAP